ncbi:hypothetical protein P5673_006411, partial [Acropora cervicornis]
EPFTRFSALCLRECQQARRDILQTDLQVCTTRKRVNGNNEDALVALGGQKT